MPPQTVRRAEGAARLGDAADVAGRAAGPGRAAAACPFRLGRGVPSHAAR